MVVAEEADARPGSDEELIEPRCLADVTAPSSVPRELHACGRVVHQQDVDTLPA